MNIFYCLIWDSPNLEGQVPVFITPRNRVAQLYPLALGWTLFSNTSHLQLLGMDHTENTQKHAEHTIPIV
jgi:hypothetical protein